MRRVITIFIFLISWLVTVPAQNPVHHTIGETELSGVDIYSLFWDDNEDLLYAATNNGVFVRRQNRFIPLNLVGEHVGSSYFHLQQTNGRIFCSNLNGQLFEVNGLNLEIIFQIGIEEHWSSFNYMIAGQDLIDTPIRKCGESMKMEKLRLFWMIP